MLELQGYIDCSNSLTGADRAGGGRQAFAALSDAQPWGRVNRLDDAGRDGGAIHVDNDDIEPAHDGAAECPGENCKRDQRYRNQQKQTGASRRQRLGCILHEIVFNAGTTQRSTEAPDAAPNAVPTSAIRKMRPISMPQNPSDSAPAAVRFTI